MSLIQVSNLTFGYEGSFDNVFENASFSIDTNWRCGFIGRNGRGKTTFLNLLLGKYAYSGTISASVNFEYFPFEVENPDDTPLEIAESIMPDFEMWRLTREFNLLDADPGLLYRPYSTLSYGERTKVLLSILFIRENSFLLIDEPTNHLDIESIEWLEDFLMNNAKAVMVISHDKAFVDHITTRTIEIARGRIYDYKVNYSHYLELRRERREQQQAAYDNQQKMIAETREFIERFKGTYSKTNQVQSRVRMLEKLELIEVDEEDRSALNLRFPPAPRSGSYPVITSELGKAYGDHRVFSDVSITIGRGDKVAFVGRNGEGKSTMVKAIMGQIDFEGEIRIGHNVRIGYFAQNEASGLDESITVFKTVDDIAVGDIRTRIRDILGAFMFGKEASEKLVKVLSGGERTRLAMIKLLLEPVNLLILDEPTNHLDLKTKEILKEALMAFDGTLIVVSHDREFLDGMVSKVYEFRNGGVREYLGGIYYFLEKRKLESLQEVERKDAPAKEAAPKASSSGKLTYEQKKEQEKLLRKLRKAVETIEASLADLEKKIADYDRKFAEATQYNEADYKAYNELKAEYDHQMHEWEKASYELEITEGE